MQYRISEPQKLQETIALPASKSISNRALVLHALSHSDETLLANVSACDDTFVMQRALALLKSASQQPATIDIMAAGTAMRFLTALLATTLGRHHITGSERMRHRPIGLLVDALRTLGAQIGYAGQTGFPPLDIEGRQLLGGRIDIPGNVSSQYISALLMIAPLMSRGLELHLTGHVVSRPYIRMTVAMMRHYGADVRWHGNRTICVAPKPYTPTHFEVEADWSAAAFWFEMTALCRHAGSEIRLPRLNRTSLQGDADVRHVFSQLGVGSRFVSESTGSTTLFLWKEAAPKAERLEYDFTRIPDLAQAAVVTCCMAGRPFRFSGLQTLRIKETDRIDALQRELQKLGVQIQAEPHGVLRWDGPERQADGTVGYLQPVPGTVIQTYDDHRMAMAFAPVALTLGAIVVNDPEVVSKSYPDFWSHLRQAGFGIEPI